MTFFAVRWCCCPMCTVSILTLWSWNTDGKFFWQLVGNMTLKNILPHRSWSVLDFRKCWKSFFQKITFWAWPLKVLQGKIGTVWQHCAPLFLDTPTPRPLRCCFERGARDGTTGNPKKTLPTPSPPPHSVSLLFWSRCCKLSPVQGLARATDAIAL